MVAVVVVSTAAAGDVRTSLLEVRSYRNRRSTAETELRAFGIQLHFASLPSFPTETLKETED